MGSNELATFLIMYISFFVIGLAGVMLILLVVVYFCCRKTRGHQGHVIQRDNTRKEARVNGIPRTSDTSYRQTGNTNAAFRQHQQATNVARNDGQNFESPKYIVVEYDKLARKTQACRVGKTNVKGSRQTGYTNNTFRQQ